MLKRNSGPSFKTIKTEICDSDKGRRGNAILANLTLVPGDHMVSPAFLAPLGRHGRDGAKLGGSGADRRGASRKATICSVSSFARSSILVPEGEASQRSDTETREILRTSNNPLRSESILHLRIINMARISRVRTISFSHEEHLYFPITDPADSGLEWAARRNRDPLGLPSRYTGKRLQPNISWPDLGQPQMDERFVS
ncbi:uncharacterized protein BP5553_02325 [Venustampulla echinocandica]|uniref:Uncharacterized protein n=1 Tax=Venustampulla echinocandica TaxID=2656787 RepID=A0A370U3J6_9HELO|nr:uncharacterized protein BP5553_02325 [Venustampulla echinocandica]RDL42346.1 hypothetical protein BP5553_02325 [Venustampulla echinocandica]